MSILTVNNITKYYQRHLALSNVSFSLKAGEVVGILGVNGAGKSTLMNILAGYLAPTTGSVLLNNQELLFDPLAAKRHIGYLPEHPPLYNELTVYEYLQFIAEIRLTGQDKRQQQQALELVMQQLNITAVKNKLILYLSKGYRQRVGIAASLLGLPALLIWDEPTAGLDPKQLKEIYQLVAQLKTKHTLLISSHMLHELESLCDRVLVMQAGSLITISTPQSLKQQFESYRHIDVEVSKLLSEQEIAYLKASLPNDTTITCTPQLASCSLSITLPAHFTGDGRVLIWQQIKERNWDLLRFMPKEFSLEESFLHLTQSTYKDKI